MSLGTAFRFPFNNMAKVMMIVLGYAITIALLMLTIFSSQSWGAMMLVGAVVLLAQALFLSGYGTRVIEHISDGYDNLPPIKIMTDIGRGFVMTLGVIIYMLPMFGYFLVVGAVSSLLGYELGVIVMLASLLGAIPLSVLVGLAFVVGMARFGIEANSGALFEMGRNWRIARNNIGVGLSLIGNQILLTIVYWIVSQVVSLVYNGIVPSSIYFDGSQTTLMVVLVIGYILTMTVSIISQVSSLHLIAQFADQIGLTAGKYKPKNDDFAF